jgi:pimeloyl-ACP methyl ester carboxylesterase
MPRFSANGADLYYEVHGTGAPILGIHGTPSSALLWVDPAQALATVGRCIIYDRRGFFRSAPSSPMATLDLEDHLADAVALLDGLDASPAVIVGRSTGGQIALALAHRHPDRVTALILLEPALFTIDPAAADWADRLRARVLLVATENPASAAEAVFRIALGDQDWEQLPAELATMLGQTSPAVLAEINGRGLDLSADPLMLTADDLAAIDRPTLLVSAEDSPRMLHTVNASLAEALPDAELVRVTGGHLINPGHPVVLKFIGRVLGHRN